jgi:hypothetical protein
MSLFTGTYAPVNVNQLMRYNYRMSPITDTPCSESLGYKATNEKKTLNA